LRNYDGVTRSLLLVFAQNVWDDHHLRSREVDVGAHFFLLVNLQEEELDLNSLFDLRQQSPKFPPKISTLCSLKALGVVNHVDIAILGLVLRDLQEHDCILDRDVEFLRLQVDNILQTEDLLILNRKAALEGILLLAQRVVLPLQLELVVELPESHDVLRPDLGQQE
jgi:hypothetical protein